MSSFFDSASLVQIPSGYSDGTLYSVKPIDGTGDLTFSRGSDIEATRVASNGYIQKAAVNLLLQSNSFDTTWTNTDTTETGGQTGYDGSNDAWLLTATSTSSTYIDQSLSTNSVVTLSVYAKANTADFIELVTIGGGLNPRAWFDLSTGSVGTSYNVIDTNIEAISSGWYRCSITLSGSITNYRFYATSADNSTSIGIGDSIYIQDAQLNYGLVAQDYVETTTTSVVTGITNDLPRLDYSGGASCPSLLLEPSRQNLVTQSEYIDGLSKTGVSITSNETTSPEGVVNASKVAYTSGTAYIVGGSSLTTGVDYTFSGFFKADESPYLVVNQAGAGAKNAFYNLLDGTHSGASGITTDMVDYGNGWYRITYTDNLLYDSIRIYMSGNGSYGNYPSVGEGFFAYGFQTEQASYPTSYIPTYGASATRTAESCSKTGVASLIGSAAGTIYLEAAALANDLSERRFAVSNGTTGNVARVGFTNINNRILAVLYNGANQCVLSYSSADITQMNKIAFTWAENDFALFVNGVKRSSDTFGSTFAANTLTEIHFNEGDGSGNDMYGEFNQVLLFTSRLSDTELATLTA